MNPTVKIIVAGLFAALLVGSTYSAPVVSKTKKETQRTEDKRGSVNPVSAVEEELENLAAAQHATEKSEKKTSDTPDFIKHAIKQAKAAETSSQEETSASTNVAPSYVEPERTTEQLQQLLNEVRSNFDVSPRTVAKYLLIDGDFDGFNKALDEVVNAGVLSPADVARFREEVSWHYDNLLRNLVESKDSLPEDSAYVPYEEYPRDLEYDTYQPSLLEDYDRALSRMQLKSYIDKQASLDSLLRHYISDYYNKYGVDESYENYDPAENTIYDDSFASDYSNLPAYLPQVPQEAQEPVVADKKSEDHAAPEETKTMGEPKAKRGAGKKAAVKKEKPNLEEFLKSEAKKATDKKSTEKKSEEKSA